MFKSFFSMALIFLAAFVFQSCTSKDPNKAQAERRPTQQEQKELWAKLWGAKPVEKLDTVLLKREIDSLFTKDTLLKYYSPGISNFYLTIIVDEKHRSGYYYSPDLQWNSNVPTVAVFGNPEEVWNRPGIFRRWFDNKKGIFSFRSQGHQVYEIRKGIDKNGRITSPVTITEVDMEKYRPIIDDPWMDTDFLQSYDIAGIMGGYDALSSKIKYPEEAKKNGIEGKVIIQVYVYENGKVAGTKLLKGIGYGCDEAAIQAVRQVEFFPDEHGSKSWRIVPVEFELEYKSTSFDLTGANFIYTPVDPATGKQPYNNVKVAYKNIGSTAVNTERYNIFIFIDGKMIFASARNSKLAPGKEGFFWVRYDKPTKGEHEYMIYIDPENVLKEENRINNIVKGKFTVN